MFRFFADSKNGDVFVLSKDTLKHMKVARTMDEHFIIVFKEKFYKCIFFQEQVKIIEEIKENHEHDGEVIIAASFINTKRFEWLIQKAAELGATKIIPIISKNVSNKSVNEISKKLNRWNEISKNASEQSFRNKQMIVTDVMKFEEAIKIKIKNKFIAYVANEKEPLTSFPTNSIFFVGPEGGYTPEEINLATSAGLDIISLGKRILRAETASIFCLARVNSI